MSMLALAFVVLTCVYALFYCRNLDWILWENYKRRQMLFCVMRMGGTNPEEEAWAAMRAYHDEVEEKRIAEIVRKELAKHGL